jgi:drug/metabolite transporter (DMT)-like permease
MPGMTTRTAGRGAAETRGFLAMAGCAFLWSLAGLFIKLSSWNAFAIAGGRSTVAFLFLWACVRRPRFTFSLPQIGAAAANVATMLLFIYANKATSSANAILLQYGAPIYVAVIGAFLLKEKPRSEHWLALGAIVVGMVLLFADGLGHGSFAGNFAAALAGLTFALNIVFMRMQKEGSPVESLMLSHAATALIGFAVAAFLPAPSLDLESLAAVLGLGVLQIGLASVLYGYAIRRISAVESVLVAVIEPVMNPVWVLLATGEAPSPRAIAGGAVIVAAVVLSTVVSVRRDKGKKTQA